MAEGTCSISDDFMMTQIKFNDETLRHQEENAAQFVDIKSQLAANAEQLAQILTHLKSTTHEQSPTISEENRSAPLPPTPQKTQNAQIDSSQSPMEIKGLLIRDSVPIEDSLMGEENATSEIKLEILSARREIQGIPIPMKSTNASANEEGLHPQQMILEPDEISKFSPSLISIVLLGEDPLIKQLIGISNTRTLQLRLENGPLLVISKLCVWNFIVSSFSKHECMNFDCPTAEFVYYLFDLGGHEWEFPGLIGKTKLGSANDFGSHLRQYSSHVLYELIIMSVFNYLLVDFLICNYTSTDLIAYYSFDLGGISNPLLSCCLFNWADGHYKWGFELVQYVATLLLGDEFKMKNIHVDCSHDFWNSRVEDMRVLYVPLCYYDLEVNMGSPDLMLSESFILCDHNSDYLISF